MKRFLILFLVLLQMIGFAGCGRQDVASADEFVQTEETETTQQSAITETTETESEETPAEPEHNDQEFVLLADYIPTAKLDIAYATENNFTGKQVYDFTDTYLRYGTTKKLMQVSEKLEESGLGLIIWDAFRPVAAQAKLWEARPNPSYVSNPVTGKRTHSRGNTVDISLYDLATGGPVPVPTEYDDYGDQADRDYSDCPEDAAANAQLLEQIMTDCGFTPYFEEWWHFTDATDYPVDEYFNPGAPWMPNCKEYISLRETGNGTVLAEIPKGEAIQLLGWSDKYAKVKYNGLEGYVSANYIMPQSEDYFAQCLDTVRPTDTYTHSQMVVDMAALKARHPNAVTLSSIGTSELGVDIPVLLIGNVNAKYHILLQGAIHGREHMTAWLLMALADYWLDHSLLSYGNVCYHIIPLTNPDGVTISQTGALTEEQRQIYLSDQQLGYTTLSESAYAYTWKANGLGVDINRNFSSGWETITGKEGPSSEGYRGTEAFSAAEAAALRDYTLQYNFNATLNYHAFGSIIYYQYGDKQPVNSQSLSLGSVVSRVTGYSLVSGSSVASAGYKDWVMDELGIPSITVEIGTTEAPLAYREIYNVFARNLYALPIVAKWVQS